MRSEPRIILKSCPKAWREDLDKAVSPEETLRRSARILSGAGLKIVSEIRRADSGRLGIPVYLSVCGPDALDVIPARKQMGKGSSAAQAKASALMELVERFSFFSFWSRREQFEFMGWKEAKERFGADLVPIEDIIKSVNDKIPARDAESLLELCEWAFYPATRLNDGKTVWIPLDWFRMLGEFNGSSAGNTPEESILQGLSELIERHACYAAEKAKKPLPTISAENCADPKLRGLIEAFKKNGVNLLLKDFSMGMPLPVVAALAWDPSTFPQSSEIVFTAGAASSPAKAAIRAITEAAQLGGDFHTNSCYEASGLSKPGSLEDCAWILEGPVTPLDQLPDASDDDIREELRACLARIEPVYAVETTHPRLGIPAHYCVAPGTGFRERAPSQSVGLFTARKLVEDKPLKEALEGLEKIAAIIPGAPWLPFYQGLARLNNGLAEESAPFFKAAAELLKNNEEAAMAQFYLAYALTSLGAWEEALPPLEEAVSLSPDSKEYLNLLGAACYKSKNYEKAEEAFNGVLRLDKGSAIDLANRGVCRMMLGKKEEAAQDLETALALDASLDFAAARLAELRNS